ncbi:Putative major facilitator superfamily, MFS transporter superfamily [Septoria linicola]|uniref:Major facilitator superfamily, MFS transporter superfamily n=1 Tax=Septoria linicola TaxID=215465 RepID=A0A9Q9EIQ0_9PEZI|nr:Putative major facilitator superfamily, MFS transporter superfamily [Septoria linicola]
MGSTAGSSFEDEVKQVSTPSTTPSSSPATSIIDVEEDSPGYRVSLVQKCLVVFTTSFVTLTACFSSTSLFSAANIVAEDFGTTADIINYTSAGVLFTMGLSTFVWGPLIPLWGRLYAWNTCLVALLVWTLAASFAPNVESFIVFRVLSGFSGTFFHVTGQTILAEYFPPVQRGTATGFFLCGTVLGPPLGPLVAGIITTFTSWRVILWVQAGMVGLGLAFSLIFLRRGGKPATVEHPSIADILQAWNPMRVFRLMRCPNLLFTDLACGLLSFAQYALLSSPRHILVSQYHLTSPLISGLFYLSPAAGFLAGTLIGGHFSDRTVRQWIQHRNGLRLPQDRLRSGFASWFMVIPVASLIFGWCVETKLGGLPVPLVFAFLAAAGMLAAFAGLNTYCAEVMPLQRSEAIASKYLVQYTCSALASAFAVPLIDAVGVGIQCTISTVLVFIAGSLCVIVALFGIKMQCWVDERWPSTTMANKPIFDAYDGPALEHVRSAP